MCTLQSWNSGGRLLLCLAADNTFNYSNVAVVYTFWSTIGKNFCPFCLRRLAYTGCHCTSAATSVCQLQQCEKAHLRLLREVEDVRHGHSPSERYTCETRVTVFSYFSTHTTLLILPSMSVIDAFFCQRIPSFASSSSDGRKSIGTVTHQVVGKWALLWCNTPSHKSQTKWRLPRIILWVHICLLPAKSSGCLDNASALTLVRLERCFISRSNSYISMANRANFAEGQGVFNNDKHTVLSIKTSTDDQVSTHGNSSLPYDS